MPRFALITILVLAGFVRAAEPSITIDWDRATLRYICDGVYPRMLRLKSGEILLSCDAGGKSIVRRSADNGTTWSDPIAAATFDHGICANTSLIQLDDASILLFYNERPYDRAHHYTIRLTQSRDAGRRWTRCEKPIYEADTLEQNGCWEPTGVQLANSDILVFFANENPYRHSNDQEISVARSKDRGETWTEPTQFSFRAGSRDGMPIPLILQNGKLVVAIEDELLTPDRKLKPVILDAADDTNFKPIPANDPRRIPAVIDPWAKNVYAGGPFIAQLKSGETLLSCQSDESRIQPQMVVYIGDANARNFSHPTAPFDLPKNVSGKWNSLFVADDNTIMALTSTRIDKKSGVWAITGRIKRAR